MNLRSALVAAAAASLATAPVAAQASAQPLPARQGSEISDAEAEQLRGGWIIPLLAIIAIVLGILAATGGDGEDLPHSP